jgi:hypothetical protein
MLTVSDADLLDLWEWGAYHNVIERSLALVAVLLPEQPIEELARQPLGLRNQFLLRLREALFGPLLDLQTACPQCAESLEMQIPIAGLLAAPETGTGVGDSPTPHTELSLEAGGQRIRFRLPNSLDLLAAAAAPQPRRMLLERCVTGVGAVSTASVVAESDETASAAAAKALPPEAEALLVARMQALDPLANASFALTCPACGHAWAEPFDIAACIWTEIDAWAYRTLREIHGLASSYHWSEADILALSPLRRQAYLQMSGYA